MVSPAAAASRALDARALAAAAIARARSRAVIAVRVPLAPGSGPLRRARCPLTARRVAFADAPFDAGVASDVLERVARGLRRRPVREPRRLAHRSSRPTDQADGAAVCERL